MVAGKHPAALVFDGNHIWVANTIGDSLMKLSTDGTVLVTFLVGDGPGALAFDGGHLWVANTGLELTTEDPPPGTVSKLTLNGELVGEFPVGGWPRALAFDGQWMWVANLVDKTVMKLALDGSLVGELELDLMPTALAVVEGQIWMLTADDGSSIGELDKGAIVVVSPTMEVVAKYPTGLLPLSILFDGEAVWVANVVDSTVTKMAPDGTVLATATVETPFALGFDGKSIWVATVEGFLFQLSLDGEMLSVLPAVGNSVAMAWDGRALWLAHPASPDVLSATTAAGSVSRLEVHDAPAATFPLESGPEELAAADAQLSQYVLSNEEAQPVPGLHR